MKILSPSFEYDAPIPPKYTCDGENINPPLQFKDVPSNVVSLAMIIEDVDAPGGNFIHWLIWNMMPDTGEIRENQVPKNSVQGMNSMNQNGYTGPCPPSGTHRYYFRLFALNNLLTLPENTTVDELRDAMKGHIVAKDELLGLYTRM